MLYLQHTIHLLSLNFLLNSVGDYILSDRSTYMEQNNLLPFIVDGAVSGIVTSEALLIFAPTSIVGKSITIGVVGAGLPQILSGDSSDSIVTTISAALHISTIITIKHLLKYKVIDIVGYMISPAHLMTFCLGGAAGICKPHDAYENTAINAQSLAYTAFQGCINVAAYEVYDFGEKWPHTSGALIEALDSFLSNVMSYFIHEKVEHEDMVLDVYP